MEGRLRRGPAKAQMVSMIGDSFVDGGEGLAFLDYFGKERQYFLYRVLIEKEPLVPVAWLVENNARFRQGGG
jgi:hypothetical protein